MTAKIRKRKPTQREKEMERKFAEITAAAAPKTKDDRPECTIEQVKAAQIFPQSTKTARKGQWSALRADRTRSYELPACRLRFPDDGTPVAISDMRECLRDTHVMFVGDSLTRYQYLSFVEVLATGKWANRSIERIPGAPSILREPDFHHEFHRREDGLWKELYMWSSRLMGGNEMCDCWRGNRTFNAKAALNQIENRFFRLKDYNLSVSYLQRIGPHITFRGHKKQIGWDNTSVLDFDGYDHNALDQWPFDWRPKNISEVKLPHVLRNLVVFL